MLSIGLVTFYHKNEVSSYYLMSRLSNQFSFDFQVKGYSIPSQTASARSKINVFRQFHRMFVFLKLAISYVHKFIRSHKPLPHSLIT